MTWIRAESVSNDLNTCQKKKLFNISFNMQKFLTNICSKWLKWWATQISVLISDFFCECSSSLLRLKLLISEVNMLTFDVRPSAKLFWDYFLILLKNWCHRLLFDSVIRSDCDRWYHSVRLTNSSVLSTESVCEVEDNDMWRKLQESASESVICLIKLSLQ